MLKSALSPFRKACPLVFMLGASMVTAASAYAANVDGKRQQVNGGTVGIMAGSLTSSDAVLSNDLAKAFDDGYDLRVVTMIGKGSLLEIEDLLYLKGVDIAMAQADVLDFCRINNIYPHIEQSLRYIAKINDEAVHILARKDFRTIDELNGRRVNFGPNTGGTFMTSTVVFDRLGIDVDISNYRNDEALEKLRAGEIDAMVRASSVPVSTVEEVALGEPLHLLPLPAELLSGSYLPTVLTASDYPNLIAAGTQIQTVEVAKIMAAYHWPRGHKRGAKLARFIDRFVKGFDQLRDTSSYDPSWQNVDLGAPVPGWQRSPFMEDALASLR